MLRFHNTALLACVTCKLSPANGNYAWLALDRTKL